MSRMNSQNPGGPPRTTRSSSWWYDHIPYLALVKTSPRMMSKPKRNMKSRSNDLIFSMSSGLKYVEMPLIIGIAVINTGDLSTRKISSMKLICFFASGLKKYRCQILNRILLYG